MSGLTRRILIGTGMATGGALVRGAGGEARADDGRKAGMARIDIHQHIIPPEFLAALARHGMSAWAPAPWSQQGALALMDSQEIATGILSLSTPGTHMGDDAEARLLTRQVNERMAELVKSRPDRFSMFASVPLPDIDGSLEAIRHAYDELGADGVILLASHNGVYLGNPVFDPVMAELDRRSAVVLVHPVHLEGPGVPGVHPSLVDFLLDTTRAAVNMVLHGVPRRYPNVKMILPHAGGFLPYAAYRVAVLASVVDRQVNADELLADLSSFYFDTALSGSPTALPSLLAFARPGHVLFGSDWPYCPDGQVGYFDGNLDSYTGLDPAGLASINAVSAQALLPRLAASRVKL